MKLLISCLIFTQVKEGERKKERRNIRVRVQYETPYHVFSIYRENLLNIQEFPRIPNH